MPKKLKPDAPIRSVLLVGPGGFVKIDGEWFEVETNTAFGAKAPPRHWVVQTTDGREFSMFEIERYALAEDFKP